MVGCYELGQGSGQLLVEKAGGIGEQAMPARAPSSIPSQAGNTCTLRATNSLNCRMPLPHAPSTHAMHARPSHMLQPPKNLRAARFDVVFLDESMRITRGDRVRRQTNKEPSLPPFPLRCCFVELGAVGVPVCGGRAAGGTVVERLQNKRHRL